MWTKTVPSSLDFISSEVEKTKPLAKDSPRFSAKLVLIWEFPFEDVTSTGQSKANKKFERAKTSPHTINFILNFKELKVLVK